jgi:nicotinamide phosphoribosyltransferase
MRIPFPLVADAYTISSNSFSSEQAKLASTYNICNRYGAKRAFPELAKDNRMVFWGISQFVEEYMQTRITMEDIYEAEHFMANRHSFGGPLHFPKELWWRVVHECGGYLPIQIHALEEGRTFFPNEPYCTVQNLIEGFGELNAHIEKILVPVLGIGTAAATMLRHWLERMREQVTIDLQLLGKKKPKLDDIDAIARWMIHNFGGRANSFVPESVLIGMAHLLSFHGTDNFDAAYVAWKRGAQHPTGTSIHALAHRNVLGHIYENDAFAAIANSDEGNVKIVSCVSDTYKYSNAVEAIVEQAKQNQDVTYVVRPDSGDCFETIKAVYEVCKAKGVYTEKNGYLLPKNVRFIYGDSVKPKLQFEVMEKLREHGMLPTQWGIWGVGGYIRNNCTRDTLSTAMKLCLVNQAVDYLDEGRPVVKLSETASKMSVPYHTFIGKGEFPRVTWAGKFHVPNLANQLETIYYNIGNIYPGMFNQAQHLAIHEFAAMGKIVENNPDFGSERQDVLPQDFIEVQNNVFAEHRGNA